MKETDAKPVGDEAAPLVIGGEATKPARKFNKKRFFVATGIIVAVLLVAAAAVAAWWVFLRQDPAYLDISKLNSENKYVKMAQQFAAEPVPKEPRDKAIHYGNVAAMLKSAKEYKYSERYYLLAQKIVDDNKVDKKDVEFYQGLSELYKAMGNKQKADEYAKKEQDFLNANYPADVLKQMREAKVNDRPR